ncbi:MAG: ABC transporter ATP-binding protein [Anaerolineaceae bacterium]|nr:ABC transporter ATP-binding protein [Anaerolineaceae bacterium]
MADLLEFKNVTKVFSRGLLSKTSTTALANISLKLDADHPTIMTVAGESGSGKTTLAMLLLGFIPPSSGQILYKGQDISQLRGTERVMFRREVQAVFQDPFAVFNPFYTVDHLLSVPIARFNLAKSKKEARDIMYEALTKVGLRPEDVLGRFPHQISGGQRQRINVARALVLRPKLLVADEPVSMVDASLRASILETLVNLQKDYGVSIIYITHDLTTAYHIAKSIIVLYRGEVMEAGGVDTVIKSPQHPYTKLLIDSIPWPDLNRRWGETQIKARESELNVVGAGCKFASRCPFKFWPCENPTPLFRLSDKQVTSCYLHEKSPQISTEELSNMLLRV